MNYQSAPLNRPHSNILCQCRACRCFDYAQTTEMKPLSPQPKQDAFVFKVIRVIDTETGKQSTYYRLFEIMSVTDTETGKQSTYYHPVY